MAIISSLQSLATTRKINGSWKTKIRTGVISQLTCVHFGESTQFNDDLYDVNRIVSKNRTPPSSFNN